LPAVPVMVLIGHSSEIEMLLNDLTVLANEVGGLAAKVYCTWRGPLFFSVAALLYICLRMPGET